MDFIVNATFKVSRQQVAGACGAPLAKLLGSELSRLSSRAQVSLD
jgi:hypothetical protein